MSVERTTPPAKEPITLAEVKAHLRFDSGDEDALLNRLIETARRRVEQWEWRAHITQTWTGKLDEFPPCNGTIYLPFNPVQLVGSITYLDTDGVSQTLVANTDYTVDVKSQPARITPAYLKSWPTTRNVIDAVTVTWTAGYGTEPTDVPDDTRTAILMLIEFLWMNRGGDPADPPAFIDGFLDRCHDERVLRFFR